MTTQSSFDSSRVERKIHFYRVDAGNDEAGRPIPYDPTDALLALRGLNYQQLGDGSPYLDTTDGNALSCWVDRIDPPQRARYVRIRRNGLPSLLQSGTLGPLGIPADSGLAEEIHVTFFPDNIVGSDFNFYGPRASTLAYYLREKANGVEPSIRIDPLLDLDTTRKPSRYLGT
jgi:hypothetical protein